MAAKFKNELGDELYEACKSGDLSSAIKLSSSNPSSNFSIMMAVAASEDHVNIVEYCLSKGRPISDTVILYVLIGRAFKTYKALLASKAVDPDYFIRWYGDILGNGARKGELESGCNFVSEMAQTSI